MRSGRSAGDGSGVAGDGKVVHGDGQGKRLGVPTANIHPFTEVLPPHGVYAALAICDGEPLPAVANLGVRPTLGAGLERRLEVHLLDFAGDLYGRSLEVAFVRRLRAERKFADLDELVGQMGHDIAAARAVFAG